MNTLLQAYTEAKANSTKEFIRAIYLKYYKGKEVEMPYRAFCEQLSFIHKQEQMKAKRREEQEHSSEFPSPSSHPHFVHQRIK